jgi:hypothetical protein
VHSFHPARDRHAPRIRPPRRDHHRILHQPLPTPRSICSGPPPRRQADTSSLQNYINGLRSQRAKFGLKAHKSGQGVLLAGCFYPRNDAY